ncbi:MAG: ABC transporter ATP-binding protein [Candidatus Zixiibacteriota bacterium]
MTDERQLHTETPLSKANDWRILRRLLSYAKPYWWAVACGLFLLVINAALEISMTVLIQIGIDEYITTGDAAGLQSTALQFIAVICLILVTAYGQLFTTIWLGQRVQHDIRTRVFAHIQKQSIAFFDTNQVGRLMTRVTSDVSTLNELFSSSIIMIIGEGLTLLFIIGALLYYNWQLAMLTFATIPLLIAVIFWFRSKIRKQYRNIRTRIARLNAFAQEHISGIDQVRLYGMEEKTRGEFEGINRKLFSSQLKSVHYSALFLPMIELIGALSLAILMYAGGLRIGEGILTFGELVAFINLVERFFQPIQSLSEEFDVVQSSLAASERIFQLLDNEPEATIVTGQQKVMPSQSIISFENVWFAYEGNKWALKDISLDILPGEKLAVVGATGAGKTSLISLLYRFYANQRGTIRLNGSPIDCIPLDDLRARMGLILQDFFLFGGTIADNVRLGDSEISDKHIGDALEFVGLDLPPDRFPDGIHSPIGERGANLSTGQKQLLSFARAIAFTPEILILDEATSSVDSETECKIQQGLHRILQDRTAIIIAHRLSTIYTADRIAVLHHGELRELGTHDELLKRKDIYYRLHSLYQQSAHAS